LSFSSFFSRCYTQIKFIQKSYPGDNQMKSLFTLMTCLLLATPLQANDSHEALQEAFMTAMRAMDADGMAACYTADATSYDVGKHVVSGPEGVAASWGGFFAAYNLLEADLFNNTVENHGDTGIAWGEFKLVVEPKEGGDSMDLIGRFTDVSRNIDGTFLYVLDHVSMVPPAAEK
jgi:ketosteroid isomerase-like protein